MLNMLLRGSADAEHLYSAFNGQNRQADRFVWFWSGFAESFLKMWCVCGADLFPEDVVGVWCCICLVMEKAQVLFKI
jgi:hypothetical protein